LAEALVAIAVLVLAGTVALVLYDGARQSFKIGDNLTEQQQAVRIAFDEMTRELRQAGLNADPDGDRRRPDEPIELAADTAIVFRADFDAGDPIRAAQPEAGLARPAEGARFLTVSTGNDEIVAYALANAASDESLRFDVDVLPPVRDGVVETVELAGLALSHSAPPYTLYRITLDESGEGVRTPVIDNLRALRFTYLDGAGKLLAPAGGADDPAGLGRGARGRIRRIGVELEGLTRDPLPGREDPEDPLPGPDGRGQYRKFTIAGDVTPRNLGLFGARDLDATATPPSVPPPPALYPGHCNGLWIEWSPNPPQDEVARYEVRYGTGSSDLTGLAFSIAPGLYLDGLLDGTLYHVTVEAVDDSGNLSGPSPASQAITVNTNRPARPQHLRASGGAAALEGEILLAWTGVTENVDQPGLDEPLEDPIWPELRDFLAYRIFRGGAPDYEPGRENLLALQTPAIYHDRAIVPCRTYYYRVAARDRCGEDGPASAAAAGVSGSSVAPAAPGQVQAHWSGSPWNSPIEVRWDRVTQDADGNTIYIDSYEVQKALEPPPLSFATVAQVRGEERWRDPDGLSGGGGRAHYRVLAHDDCVNESVPSESATAECSFDGEVRIPQPEDYASFDDDDRWLAIQVEVHEGSASYAGLVLSVIDTVSGETVVAESWPGPPPWLYEWEAGELAAGGYRIRAVVEQADNGCEQSASRFVLKR
jgi:hypothetical protein